MDGVKAGHSPGRLWESVEKWDREQVASKIKGRISLGQNRCFHKQEVYKSGIKQGVVSLSLTLPLPLKRNRNSVNILYLEI